MCGVNDEAWFTSVLGMENNFEPGISSVKVQEFSKKLPIFATESNKNGRIYLLKSPGAKLSCITVSFFYFVLHFIFKTNMRISRPTVARNVFRLTLQ